MSIIFKIWNSSRTVKYSLCVSKGENFFGRFKEAADKKLKINSSSIVVEADGTVIDDEETLIFFSTLILMLLENEEKWTSKESDASDRAALVDITSNGNYTNDTQFLVKTKFYKICICHISNSTYVIVHYLFSKIFNLVILLKTTIYLLLAVNVNYKKNPLL